MEIPRRALALALDALCSFGEGEKRTGGTGRSPRPLDPNENLIFDDIRLRRRFRSPRRISAGRDCDVETVKISDRRLALLSKAKLFGSGQVGLQLLSVRLKLAHVIIEQSSIPRHPLILLPYVYIYTRKDAKWYRSPPRAGFSSYGRMKLKNEIDSARLSRPYTLSRARAEALIIRYYIYFSLGKERAVIHKGRWDKIENNVHSHCPLGRNCKWMQRYKKYILFIHLQINKINYMYI